MFSPLITQLINALRCLPGVGPKSAQRMAFQLLQHQRENGLALARILQQAIVEIKHCPQCNTFCELDLCQLCADQRRDNHALCVVETPADVVAFEQAGSYRGYYFVLMGRLSPLDGIGPKEIGMDKFLQRVLNSEIEEIILATNTTVEGEATAHYIANMMRGKNIKCTRIAYGVPVGGEVEYFDASTLSRAFSARTKIE